MSSRAIVAETAAPRSRNEILARCTNLKCKAPLLTRTGGTLALYAFPQIRPAVKPAPDNLPDWDCTGQCRRCNTRFTLPNLRRFLPHPGTASAESVPTSVPA